MNKHEAARLLGISERTLRRKYKGTRVGSGPFARVDYTHGDLGLPEPEPQPKPQTEPEPAHVDAKPEPELSADIERRALDDAEFAAAYRRGEATDSARNTINGNNDRFPSKGLQSLLGPVEEQPRHKPSGSSHMDTALVADVTAAPNPVDSDEFNELWHPGHKDRKTAMYRDARIPQPSEQELKQHVDRAAITAAFRQGYSR